MKTKILIVLLIIILAILGYVFFIKKPVTSPVIPGRNDDTVFCTQDVKECSDGSYVGRQAPDCAFAECPNGTKVKVNVELE
ncbi:MAG: hypothetical protein ACYCZW_03815 [Minisyncoccota bacterium]